MTFAKLLLPVLVGAVLVPTQKANAFALGDHKMITQQAVVEINKCFPGSITDFEAATLWTSDLDEDINFLRKDLMWSHFYNPYKKLEMTWRYTSDDRVESLESQFADTTSSIMGTDYAMWDEMGHAVHQLQDMAAPMHVVPVMHWMNDTFERYDFEGDISSGLTCEQMALNSFVKPIDLLKQTAIETLHNVDAIRVPLQIDHGKTQYWLGNAFWISAKDNGFGQYGLLGEHFGQASFAGPDGRAYSVAPKFYNSFKQKQLKLAVRATVKAVLWFQTTAKMQKFCPK